MTKHIAHDQVISQQGHNAEHLPNAVHLITKFKVLQTGLLLFNLHFSFKSDELVPEMIKRCLCITLLPENPMNSSKRITRAGSSDTIRLNVPTPMRTPLSKCTFDPVLAHCRFSRICIHSLKEPKHLITHVTLTIFYRKNPWMIQVHSLVAIETCTNLDAAFDQTRESLVFDECEQSFQKKCLSWTQFGVRFQFGILLIIMLGNRIWDDYNQNNCSLDKIVSFTYPFECFADAFGDGVLFAMSITHS